jgi:hypothetical protein
MIRTILTHPGGAHKDDVLAVCLLAAKTGAPIVRRMPTQAELDDPQVAIVDVGGRHEPANSNYDHHHFPREHPPTCALSLVLEGMGLYQDGLRFFDWLETAEWFDSRGPNQTAGWLGVNRNVLSRLNSPVDVTLMRRFGQCKELSPSDPLYAFMCMVGEDLLAHLANARERIAFVAERAERWSVVHGDERIETLFLPRTDPGSDEPSAAVANYILAEGLQDTIAAIVYPDRRGSGYGIGRYEDHPRLDFSRIEGEPDVHFAHKTGFLCKTTATDPDRLRALISGAWIPA